MCPRPRPHRGCASSAKWSELSRGGTASMPRREKRRRRPGSQPARPFSRPQPPAEWAKVRGFSRTVSAFTAETDCLLEESGFELMVPPRTERKWEGAGTHQHHLGRASELKVPPSLSFLISLRTRGIRSSILPSSGDSCANHRLRGDRARYGPRASLVSRHTGPTRACN